jgi:hypothetical protein
MRARALQQQKSYARGADSIRVGELLAEFQFVAPTSLDYSLNHQWSPVDSIASRTAQKIGDIQRAITDVKGITNNVQSNYEQLKKSNQNAGISSNDVIRNVIRSTNTEVTKTKIDASVIYTNSQHREITLQFDLAYTHSSRDAYHSVVEPIKELERLSCPVIDDDLIAIKFPAVFSLKSVPGGLIDMPYCALTSVQPSYRGVYDQGHPIAASLTLTFLSLRPTYRNEIENGNARVVVDNGTQ